jgi:CHAT domain-containing protein
MLPCISVLSYWDFDRTYRDFAQPLVLGDSLSDLPNAREEARHVAATLRAIPLLGREVLRSNLQLRLSGCDLLHVACHASYNEIQPELSGFYLSDESMVSARDLREMRLRTRLVVLSACESGRAHVDLGDETTGLAASLLYAGAHSVISTLWKVPDEETKTLMLDLYAHFLDLKVPVAVALAQAQCHMLKSPRNHPYYWAAFQFWGQWDIAFSKNHESGAQTQSAKRRRSADRSTPRLSARGRTS